MIIRLLAIVLFCSFVPLEGQIKAITENGDEVLLYDNGTWKSKSSNSSIFGKTDIPENATPYKKDVKSTFLMKSKVVNVGVWLNPSKWTVSKGEEPQEYKFVLKGESLYGMMITEKVAFPLETLKVAALQNAKGASQDVELTKEEYRTINGIRVLMLQLEGTIQGVKFVFWGYYYATEQGSVQLVTYTVDSQLSQHKSDMETFLNGLVAISNP